ncbi:MCE family protein [Mycolicibacterium insubricum]|uniref:MCE family protein n=1 Tax=Mycolicibacterium insubricum TaxID=444597 RepID=UPI001F1DBE89|nr:MCE family protein [Mycolicibacterium insubricum]
MGANAPRRAPTKRRHVPGYVRPLVGLVAVLALILVFAVAIGLFNGSFTKTVPVTIKAKRAGLVMNTDAKVKMRGVQVGKVESIESLPDGTAELRLAMNPAQMHLIPGNVRAEIAATTVFGAKYVQLNAPDVASGTLQPGQTLDAEHVTVEMNTVFQQLVSVLDKIDPVKLNQTLGAMSEAFGGRGEQFGKTVTDLNALLGTLEPSLDNMGKVMELMAPVSAAYADSAPALLETVRNTTTISSSIVDEQKNLDTFLVSLTGLADTGNDVIGSNRPALSKTLNLLVPTTDLLNEYAPALQCSLQGMQNMMDQAPQMDPGALVAVNFTMHIDRYRYPANLPKVAAKGGPKCMGLPYIGYGNKAKFLVTDTNSNPWQYGNQGVVLNSDGLKQLLFGPLDGPPRNTAQIGQPG